MNQTNRRTEFQIYWYYDSTCFGQPFRPSSGVISRTSVLVHFMQFWWPFTTRSRMERNTNKFGIQCVCWFYSQGICHDARSYDRKIFVSNLLSTWPVIQNVCIASVIRWWWMMNLKGCWRKRFWFNLTLCPGNYRLGLRETTVILQSCRFPSRNSKLAPLKRKLETFLIFCWPCISLQILGNNQLDALFHVFVYFVSLRV